MLAMTVILVGVIAVAVAIDLMTIAVAVRHIDESNWYAHWRARQHGHAAVRDAWRHDRRIHGHYAYHNQER